jgi:hypothetical protein
MRSMLSLSGCVFVCVCWLSRFTVFVYVPPQCVRNPSPCPSSEESLRHVDAKLSPGAPVFPGWETNPKLQGALCLCSRIFLIPGVCVLVVYF